MEQYALIPEEEFFARKRFLPQRLAAFGFEPVEKGFCYRAELLGGDFTAELLLTPDGKLTGKVVDNMNGEEYAQLRNESLRGAYVQSVRAAYAELLTKVADACCADVFFCSDQANRLAARIGELFGVRPDFPFDEEPHRKSGVFRHPDNRKWFALVMNIRWKSLLKNGDETRVDVVNLKADPAEIPELIKRAGVYPAYHMTHKNWITVTLDDRLSDGDILTLIENSYDLTKSKK